MEPMSLPLAHIGLGEVAVVAVVFALGLLLGAAAVSLRRRAELGGERPYERDRR